MKKIIMLVALFVLVMSITMGVVGMNPVKAGDRCARMQCLCRWMEGYCSTYTGPNCPDPDYPYYHYTQTCFKKPGEGCISQSCQLYYGEFDGCCADPD